MARKSGLGRGLTSLIPAGAGEDPDAVAAGLSEVPIESIRPNPYQPRRAFDEESLEGLSDSIKELGVLQPVLVRELDDGYELIAGERRLRAAKRAGLRTVPVVVRTADDVSSLEQALVENLHRQDLNPLEEAAAYQQLIEDFSYTQEQVAQRVGRSRSAVTNLLRLFQLPPAVQRLVGEQLISAGHAKAILGHPDRAYQEALAKRTVAEALSVRDVEQLVRERIELEMTGPDGRVIRATPGQTIYTPPGEEHWHGATPADFMEHLAMLDNADDPAATTRWLEHVTDTQYNTPITAEE